MARDGQGLLLDIGCGTGTTLAGLRRVTGTLGLDFSGLALSLAQSKGLDRLVQGAAERLPLRAEAVQYVTLLDVLEHLDDDVGALRGFHRALLPGGSLLLTVPAYRSLWSHHDLALHHRRRYTAGQLRDALEAAGFRVERLTFAICAMLPVTYAFRWLQKVRQPEATPRTALVMLPKPLNDFFIWLLTLESHVLGVTGLPFGVSLLCHAIKPD